MTWLTNLVNQHKELEAPQSFFYWSALAALSAVVKDNVWVDRQFFKQYLNVYVMLHAPSGLKKGAAISMARQLYTNVYGDSGIYVGRSSIQGILKDMGQAQSRPDGTIDRKSTAFICSSELTSSLVEDKVVTDILTDLYDRNWNSSAWRNLLKMESFSLSSPTVTMLTATNEAMSEDFFLQKAVSGGFFARTFIVYETKRNVLLQGLHHQFLLTCLAIEQARVTHKL